MRKCSNCGRTTARTEDWACQYCGYPLLSESYKKIPMSYRQLQEQKLYSLKLGPEPVAEAEPVSEPEREPIPEPELVAEAEPVSEPEREPILEPEPVPVLEREPTSGVIEVTAEGLFSVYKADEAAADTKFVNKVLKVTGIADRVVVNYVHDVYYIMLTGAVEKEVWSVRCAFDKKQGSKLDRLTAGQTVTVQGEYDGYKRNILMRDCILVD